MLQLMENSVKANRDLRALKKDRKPFLAIAQRGLAKYKQAMADFQHEMAHANANFATDPNFRDLSSHCL
jgi:hypothetical protein